MSEGISSLPEEQRGGRMGDIVVFDGVCHLCSGWVRFLLRRDRTARYRFAAMQSAAGRRLLRDHGLDADDPLSFLLVREGVAYRDSDAIVRVLSGLGGIWHASQALRVFPPFLRDPLYRWIARHRYRLFGQRSQCMVPDSRFADRFVS